MVPLEGKVAAKLTDEVGKNNDCYAIYTSPPPTAEPLLEEKPLKDLHLNLMCRNVKKGLHLNLTVPHIKDVEYR